MRTAGCEAKVINDGEGLAAQSPAVSTASNLGSAQDQISDKAETYVSTSRARAERKSAMQWIRTIASHQGSLRTTCSARR